jgi:cytidine deaminase
MLCRTVAAVRCLGVLRYYDRQILMPMIDPDTLRRLREAAEAAAHHAYAPYSKFHVGAALLFDDGTVYTGCNVENMSFGLTNCAERSALFRSVSERGADPRIVAIAVTNLNGAASPPCGACRQVMSEFVSPDAVVSFPCDRGLETRAFSEIFPFSFHLDAQ